jgi:hypothetical protein
MSILNFGGAMDTDTLRGKVDAYLKTFPGEYETHTSQVHSWFATEGDYGTYKVSGSSGREGGQQEGRVGEPVQQASGDYRSEIASIVSKAFQWALEAIKKAVLKGGPGSGRYPAGSGGEHVSEDQKNLIGPAKASKEQARTVLSKTGPYSYKVELKGGKDHGHHNDEYNLSGLESGKRRGYGSLSPSTGHSGTRKRNETSLHQA